MCLYCVMHVVNLLNRRVVDEFFLGKNKCAKEKEGNLFA